jgi:hypothetical protein
MNAPKGALRTKRWCTTLNNYTAIEYGNIVNYIMNAEPVYDIIAKELSTSGTPQILYSF